MALGLTSSLVGAFSVLRGESLIGDAIGHSVFPGVIIAFLIFAVRTPFILMIGATCTGIIAYGIIQLCRNYSRMTLDVILAIVLSSMFGLGLALKSWLQGNKKYAHASQAGLSNYIFGQAAFMQPKDVALILTVCIISILIIVLFYKELRLFVFDPAYAKASGFSNFFLSTALLIMTVAVISVGLKLVGAILVVSMLLAPVTAARYWSHRFIPVLVHGAIMSVICGFLGTFASMLKAGLSTGPMIIVFLSIWTLFSLFFGKERGILIQLIRNKRMHEETAEELDLLVEEVEQYELENSEVGVQ